MNLQLQPFVFRERNGGGVGLLRVFSGGGGGVIATLEQRRESADSYSADSVVRVFFSGRGGVVATRGQRRESAGSNVGAAYSAKTAEPHVYLTTIFGRQTGGDKKTFILWRYA